MHASALATLPPLAPSVSRCVRRAPQAPACIARPQFLGRVTPLAARSSPTVSPRRSFVVKAVARDEEVSSKNIVEAIATPGLVLAATYALIQSGVLVDPLTSYVNTVGLPVMKALNPPDFVTHWFHAINMSIVLFAMGGERDELPSELPVCSSPSLPTSVLLIHTASILLIQSPHPTPPTSIHTSLTNMSARMHPPHGAGYGAWLGWETRAGRGAETALFGMGDSKAELHPKLMAGMVRPTATISHLRTLCHALGAGPRPVRHS